MTSQTHGTRLDKIEGHWGLFIEFCVFSWSSSLRVCKSPGVRESMELKGEKLKEHFLHTWVWI